jgi:predicted DNA-binding protein with PD1-like motif
MKATVIEDARQKSFILNFESGDEVISGIEKFARESGLQNAQLTAIGGFSSATLGSFMWDSKDYKRIPVNEQVEVMTMTGNVVSDSDGLKVNAHAVLSKADGSAQGGQVLEAFVNPRMEVILGESPKIR